MNFLCSHHIIGTVVMSLLLVNNIHISSNYHWESLNLSKAPKYQCHQISVFKAIKLTLMHAFNTVLNKHSTRHPHICLRLVALVFYSHYELKHLDLIKSVHLWFCCIDFDTKNRVNRVRLLMSKSKQLSHFIFCD